MLAKKFLLHTKESEPGIIIRYVTFRLEFFSSIFTVFRAVNRLIVSCTRHQVIGKQNWLIISYSAFEPHSGACTGVPTAEQVPVAPRIR